MHTFDYTSLTLFHLLSHTVLELHSAAASINPQHGPGWIAAARVEEFAGKMVQVSDPPRTTPYI